MRMSDWSSDVCSSDLLVGLGDPRRGVEQRCLFVTRELVDTRERLVAESALGNIDDAFERQIIGGRMDETEVGERVAYFRAFVEAVAADDAVWHADRDEAVFEFARLELRADEDRGAEIGRASCRERVCQYG